jgi:hypothetical protein
MFAICADAMPAAAAFPHAIVLAQLQHSRKWRGGRRTPPHQFG